jgi:HEAT repeat protein
VLGALGPEARPAVALLRAALRDPDRVTSHAAAEALRKIDPEAARTASP